MPARRTTALLVLALLQVATLLAGTAAAFGPDRPVRRSVAAAPLEPLPPRPRLVAAPAHAVAVRVTRPRAAAAPAAHRAPRPRPVHHARPRPRPVQRHVVVRHRAPRTTHHASFSTQLRQDVARIPGYRTGIATWTVTSSYGHWGMTDLNSGAIYISPSVPTRLLYAVAAHEWSHALSMHVYGGNVDQAVAAMDAWFGGSGLLGAERAADCMARQLGATWTNYTSCSDSRWRAGAAQLLAGQPLGS